MLISFPQQVQLSDVGGVAFARMIEEESGGELTVSIAYPDAIPPFEQFEPIQSPIQSGVFDIVFTHPSYHAGITSLGLAIDGSKTGPTARREAGILDFVDQHYQKLGVRVIAMPPQGSQPLRIYLNQPVKDGDPLDGLKIRGPAAFSTMIESLGGTGVALNAGETYSAMQKGVVDGAIVGAPAALGLKWNEVIEYYVEQGFGTATLLHLMNAERWDSLSEEHQAAISRAAIRIELETQAVLDELAAEEREKLIELGMKATRFSDETMAKIDTLWANSNWSRAAEGEPEATAKLREIARAAGLSD